MPELPEVETVIRGLRPHLLGAAVAGAHAVWPRVLDGGTLESLNDRLAGRSISPINRRGKYICIDFGGPFLVIHLRMTGRLYLSDKAEGEDPWVRFSLGFSDGRHLVFSDARKFGRVVLAATLDFLETKLGPEPLLLGPNEYRKLLAGSDRAVKAFLLDQKKLAGVGNIYADEALFHAGIHPRRPVSRLKVAERVRLGEAIIQILSQAIGHEGATISWYRKPDGSKGESQKHFSVYGRQGEPCFRCGAAITRILLGQRGTHYCHRCQK